MQLVVLRLLATAMRIAFLAGTRLAAIDDDVLVH